MKKVLLDSSSAILMEKTDLLEIFLKVYEVTLTQGVYEELTHNRYPSARIFIEGQKAGRFEVCEFVSPTDSKKQEPLNSLNRGERETILQFLSGTYNFIMLDDGKAAKHCLKKKLPFINALLLPRILCCAKIISQRQQEQYTASVLQIGRYSEQIIQMAIDFSCENLAPFLP